MKILIVGGGGREHAIAWKLAKSPKVEKMYCAPGNAGIAEVAECVNIGVMEFDKLVAFAKEHEIDLTVVAPDDPLAAGAVDAFEAAGLRAFGPRANAAILEGSKAFSKDLMKKYGIPTAAYETFNDPEKALAYLETAKMPIVLKADGLALGKGVLICKDLEEAKAGVRTLMMDKQFGSAGDEIVIEEFMTGREVSVLSFVDGTCQQRSRPHPIINFAANYFYHGYLPPSLHFPNHPYLNYTPQYDSIILYHHTPSACRRPLHSSFIFSNNSINNNVHVCHPSLITPGYLVKYHTSLNLSPFRSPVLLCLPRLPPSHYHKISFCNARLHRTVTHSPKLTFVIYSADNAAVWCINSTSVTPFSNHSFHISRCAM